MQPSEIKGLRSALGLSVAQFAALCGATRVTVYSWEKGQTFPVLDGAQALIMKAFQRAVLTRPLLAKPLRAAAQNGGLAALLTQLLTTYAETRLEERQPDVYGD